MVEPAEIEITPEMIQAADAVYGAFWRNGGFEERDGFQMVLDAYRAMARESSKGAHSGRPGIEG